MSRGKALSGFWTAALLAGCGPSPESSTNPAPPPAPPVAASAAPAPPAEAPRAEPAPPATDTGDQADGAGLPLRLRFDGRDWTSRGEVVEAEPDSLTRLGEGPEGQEVFAPPGSRPPHAAVLVPLPDEAGAFLKYRR